MWLAVANPDVPEAVSILQALSEAEARAAIPDDALRARATAVVDLDAVTTTCPACEAEVPGGSSRCPSCRLRFA